MANQIQSRWTYPLVGVSTSKTLPRVSSNPRTAFELTGVDGSLRGGLRPFPGFKKAHTFRGGSGDVTDYALFELRLDADSAAHGVAYIRGGNIHIDLKFPDDQDWTTHQAYDGGDATGPIEAVSWAKVVYVLCRGRPPIAVRGYKNEADPPLNEIGVVDPAGPGEKPRAGCIFTDGAGVGDAGSFVLDPIPLLDNTATFSVWQPDQGEYALSWAEVDTDADSLVDDLNADGLTLLVRRRNTSTFEDPRYALHAKGDYALAYSFYDSRTGRKSMISDTVELRAEDVDGEGEAAAYTDNEKNLTFEWVWHPLPALDEANNLPPEPGSETLGLTIPKRFDEKWDRIYIWRSVKVESAGGAYVAGILHLDKIYPFRHQYTDPDSGDIIEETGLRYIYGLQDTELCVQDTHLDHNVYFKTMPRGGTGTILNDVLYIADIVPDPVVEDENGNVTSDVYPNEALEGVGEVRWSQPLDPHPELFHWTGRHMPSTVTERPLRLFTVGEGVMAISRNRAMVVRRKGAIVLVDEIHEGYGTANRNACASIADSVWFLSNKGLKKVSVTGVLSDVPLLDELIVQDWASELSSCEVSFDHRSGCLWILNPVQGRAVLLWMETGMLTELEELPFSAVRSGMWPGPDGVHVKRSVFLKGDSLWVADHDRTDSLVRLLKTEGESLGTVLSVDPPTQSSRGSVVVRGREGGLCSVEPGMWVRILGGDGSGVRKQVESVTVLGVESTIVFVDDQVLPQVGDTLQFSPVVVRWGGGILGARNEEGMAFLSSDDMFRSRQLSSVGCVFDSLSGDGQFRAVAYYGTRSTPDRYGEYVTLEESQGLPSKYSAFGTYGVSHSSLSPGVEILCTDLDFRLLSVICRGRIDASDRAR